MKKLPILFLLTFFSLLVPLTLKGESTGILTSPVYRFHAQMNDQGVIATIATNGWVLSTHNVLDDRNPYIVGFYNSNSLIFKLDGVLFRAYSPTLAQRAGRSDFVDLYECKKGPTAFNLQYPILPQTDQYTSTDQNCETGSYVGYREYLGVILNHPAPGHAPIYRAMCYGKHITIRNPAEVAGLPCTVEGVLGYALTP